MAIAVADLSHSANAHHHHDDDFNSNYSIGSSNADFALVSTYDEIHHCLPRSFDACFIARHCHGDVACSFAGSNVVEVGEGPERALG